MRARVFLLNSAHDGARARPRARANMARGASERSRCLSPAGARPDGSCSIYGCAESSLAKLAPRSVKPSHVLTSLFESRLGVLVHVSDGTVTIARPKGAGTVFHSRYTWQWDRGGGAQVRYVELLEDLLRDVLQRVRLPPVEFVLTWGDKPMAVNGTRTGDATRGIFGLVGSLPDLDVVFPNRRLRPNLRLAASRAGGPRPVVNWTQRRATAYFRGAPNGVRDARSPRVEASLATLAYPALVDARLVHGQTSPFEDRRTQAVLDNATAGAAAQLLVPWSSFDEAARHKYLLSVDGIGYTERLKDVLVSGAVPIVWRSPYFEYFYCGMREGEHYVAVDDAASLAREVGRLQRDDQRARAIARRARQFAEWALSNETAACYLHRLLTGFAERAMGYAAGPPTPLGGAAGGRQGESVMAGLVHGNDTRFEYRVSRHFVSAGRSERFVAGCRANEQPAYL